MFAKTPIIGYTLQDGTNSSAILRFNMRSTIEAAPAMAAAAGFRPALAGVSSCSIVAQRVVYPFVDMGFGPPGTGASANRVGVFFFLTNDPLQLAAIEIPGIADELLMTTGAGAGLVIDIEHPAVVAFAEFLTNGAWCNRFGYTLQALDCAYLQLRG